VHRGHVLAGQPHAHHLDDVLLRHAEQRRLGLIDAQHQLSASSSTVSSTPMMSACLRRPARTCLRHGDLARVVGAIDLGDDGRQHRRAGRHFHHLGIAAMLAWPTATTRSRTETAISWLWRLRCCLSTRLTWMSPISGALRR
jgi:hypothetical protein